MFPLAVIADIHGNSWALEAVLNDIHRRGIEQIVNLGDSADADMNPARVVDLLREAGVVSIAGNYETHRPGQLSAEQVDWLAGLPKTLDLGAVFCCHRTPSSDVDALIEDIALDQVGLAASETILARLGDVGHPVVLCAHKHMPRLVALPGGRIVANPGSVGLPAYWNDEPALHCVQAGSPHARYAILAQDGGGWRVDHIAIAYPWDLAAAAARENGREDRAQFIETGRAAVSTDLLATARLRNAT